MEIKKTPKADLENKKSTWMLIGYVIVLAFMFIAFEWTKRDIIKELGLRVNAAREHQGNSLAPSRPFLQLAEELGENVEKTSRSRSRLHRSPHPEPDPGRGEQ